MAEWMPAETQREMSQLLYIKASTFRHLDSVCLTPLMLKCNRNRIQIHVVFANENKVNEQCLCKRKSDTDSDSEVPSVVCHPKARIQHPNKPLNSSRLPTTHSYTQMTHGRPHTLQTWAMYTHTQLLLHCAEADTCLRKHGGLKWKTKSESHKHKRGKNYRIKVIYVSQWKKQKETFA